ncbi:hypothetical protein A6769_39730 [Nostoc punctiforme NIES-2108]|uniref:Uncharacterized protein n=1 Tax=Nostoc punctiforme NIES-2108 TaxID=1356359 RepID=A0A367RXX7_NOSPU|nr:hypothetical protein A6769_39730 [Nostoc punctiforme NIES-2108]
MWCSIWIKFKFAPRHTGGSYRTICNSQFAIRNCGQNWELILLGLQAPQIIDEENKKYYRYSEQAPSGVG